MNYCIYKIKLFQLPEVEGDWTREEPVEPFDEKKAWEKFEFLFGEKNTTLRIIKLKKNVVDKDYPNYVLAHTHNVVLLQLNNVQIKKLWKPKDNNKNTSQYEAKEEESNPYCHVIIDCREGRRLMAVEVDHTAWNSTNAVRDVLQENIGRMLKEKFGMGLNIISQMTPSKFWDYVNYRRKKEGAYISRLTWSFKNMRKMHGEETLIKMSPHLNALNSMIKQFCGDMGELSIESSKNDPLSLNRRWADMKNMIIFSATSYYTMSVTFNDGVTYKCNDSLQAIFPIEEKAVENFKNGQIEFLFNFGLLKELDKINNKIQEYSDAEQITSKPNRKDKKSVS